MLIDNCSRFVLLYLFFFLLKFLFARLLCFHKFVIFLSKKFISSRFFPYINYFSFVLSIIIYQEQFVNFQGLDFLHSNIKAEKFLIKKPFVVRPHGLWYLFFYEPQFLFLDKKDFCWINSTPSPKGREENLQKHFLCLFKSLKYRSNIIKSTSWRRVPFSSNYHH